MKQIVVFPLFLFSFVSILGQELPIFKFGFNAGYGFSSITSSDNRSSINGNIGIFVSLFQNRLIFKKYENVNFAVLGDHEVEVTSYMLMYGRSFNIKKGEGLFNIPTEGNIIASVGISHNVENFRGQKLSFNTTYEVDKREFVGVPISIELEATLWSLVGLNTVVFFNYANATNIYGVSFNILVGIF